MSFRVFAFIVGIDKYKSGSIWNLTSCMDDALNMKRWLTNTLGVPRDHICLLLNEKATKHSIEDHFMTHLLNNPEIEPGDAIIIYFAGHGSAVPTPAEWPVSNSGKVELLCTYDQDHRKHNRRVSGISDRSLHAMIDELAEVKGRNITIIVDSCFEPNQSPLDILNRQSTRWTPSKVSSEDLHTGLWRGALSKTNSYTGGRFFSTQYDSHVLLSACISSGKATEGKVGGRFTVALLHAVNSLPLHDKTYRQLTRHLAEEMSDQLPGCFGYRKDSIVFDKVPFVPHASYIALNKADTYEEARIEAGEMHGVVEGTEFSIHEHNYHGSHNPPLGTFHASEVHHTWCIARPAQRRNPRDDRGSWAKVSKWNYSTPFRVHLRRTCASLVSGAIRRKLPWKPDGMLQKDGLTLVRVKSIHDADITLHVYRKEVVVKHHSNSHPFTIRFPSDHDHAEVVASAARFFHHLTHVNPNQPLRDKIRMELLALDPETWNPIGKNLFSEGMAKLSKDEDCVYTVHVYNDAHTDLWVHLAYMDSNGYECKMLFRPDPSMTSPPLKRHSLLIIGSGVPGSEAIKFPKEKQTVGYLKLFISSDPTCLDMIEQPAAQGLERPTMCSRASCKNEIWDTAVAGVLIS